MIQLLQGGAYLVGGTQIIEDTQEAALAIAHKTGKKVTKKEAADHDGTGEADGGQ